MLTNKMDTAYSLLIAKTNIKTNHEALNAKTEPFVMTKKKAYFHVNNEPSRKDFEAEGFF